MIVDVAIIYPLTYYRRGSRKPQVAAVWDTVPVEIGSVDRKDIEVLYDAGGDMTWSAVGDRVYLELRRDEIPVSRIAAMPDESNPFLVSTCGTFHADAHVAEAPLALRIREIVSSGRSDAIAAANARAREILLAGDRLLVPSRGPILVVSAFGYGPDRSRRMVGLQDLQPVSPGVRYGGYLAGSSVPGSALTPLDATRSRVTLREVMGDAYDPDHFDLPAHPLLSGSVREESLAGAVREILDIGDALSPWHLSLAHLDAYLRYTDPAFEPGEEAENLVQLLAQVLTVPDEWYVDRGQHDIAYRIANARDTLAIYRHPFREPEPDRDFDADDDPMP